MFEMFTSILLHVFRKPTICLPNRCTRKKNITLEIEWYWCVANQATSIHFRWIVRLMLIDSLIFDNNSHYLLFVIRVNAWIYKDGATMNIFNQCLKWQCTCPCHTLDTEFVWFGMMVLGRYHVKHAHYRTLSFTSFCSNSAHKQRKVFNT